MKINLPRSQPDLRLHTDLPSLIARHLWRVRDLACRVSIFENWQAESLAGKILLRGHLIFLRFLFDFAVWWGIYAAMSLCLVLEVDLNLQGFLFREGLGPVYFSTFLNARYDLEWLRLSRFLGSRYSFLCPLQYLVLQSLHISLDRRFQFSHIERMGQLDVSDHQPLIMLHDPSPTDIKRRIDLVNFFKLKLQPSIIRFRQNLLRFSTKNLGRFYKVVIVIN